jgi:RNase P/RNase MRP subunit POP5
MVRHKTRWLLVRLEFDPDVIGRRDEGDSRNKRRRVEDDGAELTKKDLAQCIRECISSSFGVAASGAAQDVQGMTISCMIRFRDPATTKPLPQTIMIILPTVRLYDELSRLILIRVPRDACGLARAALTFLTTIQGRSIVASVISVNGSSRTAKRVAILETRRIFREQCSPSKRELKELEARLDIIRKIE